MPAAAALWRARAREFSEIRRTGNRRWPAIPKEYQGQAITCDFRAHRIVRFNLSENGAGYAAEHLGDFIRSSSASFRPIDVKQGRTARSTLPIGRTPLFNTGKSTSVIRAATRCTGAFGA